MSKLLLTRDDLTQELMTGGFGPMSDMDWQCWSGADQGTLIAFPKRGRDPMLSCSVRKLVSSKSIPVAIPLIVVTTAGLSMV